MESGKISISAIAYSEDGKQVPLNQTKYDQWTIKSNPEKEKKEMN